MKFSLRIKASFFPPLNPSRASRPHILSGNHYIFISTISQMNIYEEINFSMTLGSMAKRVKSSPFLFLALL